MHPYTVRPIRVIRDTIFLGYVTLLEQQPKVFWQFGGFVHVAFSARDGKVVSGMRATPGYWNNVVNVPMSNGDDFRAKVAADSIGGFSYAIHSGDACATADLIAALLSSAPPLVSAMQFSVFFRIAFPPELLSAPLFSAHDLWLLSKPLFVVFPHCDTPIYAVFAYPESTTSSPPFGMFCHILLPPSIFAVFVVSSPLL